jgi:hypothetical protein
LEVAANGGGRYIKAYPTYNEKRICTLDGANYMFLLTGPKCFLGVVAAQGRTKKTALEAEHLSPPGEMPRNEAEGQRTFASCRNEN